MYSPESIARLVKSAQEKLAHLVEVETLLQDPDVIKNTSRFRDLGKELRELQRLREIFRNYNEIELHLAEALHVSEDVAADDDLREMAFAEIQQLTSSREASLDALDDALIKKNPLLEKNAIIEIRPGAGGLEASLFAGEMFRLYTKYASARGFKTELLSQSLTEAGGMREVIFSVIGEGVFGRFRYESGVHRVQRVPQTEASGRVHTSTITVMVLPEVEDVEVNIKPEDVKVDVFRSGGPGGQSVNTTDSAVRVTHLPTGLVVKCQDEKSQLKNKAKAMVILRARLFDMYQKEADDKAAAARKKQVGTGDRSEKIRTYNFPERRVTDHRIGLTVHNLDRIMEGEIDDIINALQEAERRLQ